MEAVKTTRNTVTVIPAVIYSGNDSGKESYSSSLFIQPKLAIGSQDDPLEKEADDMADKVMRMPNPEPISFSTSKNVIDRKCSECEKEEELQRKESNSDSVSVAPPIVNEVLSSSGKSLDQDTRSFMEPRFNYDFSNVKIHDNQIAAKSASSINALAYTSGNNVVFNSGQYDTNSYSGKRLLAHELTHTIQQRTNSSLQPMIQRDLAVEPTAPDAVGQALTPAQIRSAIRWNQAAFPDADEISLLRDVLGVSGEPAVIDEDFIIALVQYQSNYGLTQDGLLGAGTALRLADELQAEAGILGADADIGSVSEMAMNPAQKRMRLRSRVVSRLGQMLHQGFIGSSDNPTGVVTVRSGFRDPAVAARNNRIGINYTGSNANNSRWLQFTFSQMSAIDPGTGTRVYRTGAVTTTGGGYNYSNATTFNWNVDTVPATGSMYYEAGGSNERVAGAYTEILDQPRGWNTQAESYAASFATRPANVRLIKGFDSYLVVNNNTVIYHVRWNMYFNFNTSVSPTPDVGGNYEVLTAGTIRRLPADRKAVLDAAFPTNTVP